MLVTDVCKGWNASFRPFPDYKLPDRVSDALIRVLAAEENWRPDKSQASTFIQLVAGRQMSDRLKMLQRRQRREAPGTAPHRAGEDGREGGDLEFLDSVYVACCTKMTPTEAQCVAVLMLKERLGLGYTSLLKHLIEHPALLDTIDCNPLLPPSRTTIRCWIDRANSLVGRWRRSRPPSNNTVDDCNNGTELRPPVRPHAFA